MCDSIVLVDVTPLSLGIEVQGKHMSTIIPRNTKIPCVKSSKYTTTEDYQEQLDIAIYEGERPSTKDNHLLGEFKITGIERAKREEPEIDVTFARPHRCRRPRLPGSSLSSCTCWSWCMECWCF